MPFKRQQLTSPPRILVLHDKEIKFLTDFKGLDNP